jgi:hypothetical protein
MRRRLVLIIVSVSVLVPALVIVWILLGTRGYAPAAKLRAASVADPACRSALVAGLDKLRVDLGLGFEVVPADAEALAATGKLDRSYPRDGVRHTVSFGLDGYGGDMCSLRMWSVKEETPGSTRTRSGPFGHVAIDACRCDP